MQRYASMRDAYDSIYESNCNSKKKAKKQSVKEALDTLIESGIINEDELQSLMERGKISPSLQKDLDKMSQQLKVSNAPRVKPPNAPSKPVGDKKVPGMMDHSKKND